MKTFPIVQYPCPRPTILQNCFSLWFRLLNVFGCSRHEAIHTTPFCPFLPVFDGMKTDRDIFDTLMIDVNSFNLLFCPFKKIISYGAQFYISSFLFMYFLNLNHFAYLHMPFQDASQGAFFFKFCFGYVQLSPKLCLSTSEIIKHAEYNYYEHKFHSPRCLVHIQLENSLKCLMFISFKHVRYKNTY